MLSNNHFVSLRHTDIIDVDEKSHNLPPDKGAFEEFLVANYFCPEEFSKDGIFVLAKEKEPLWFDFRHSEVNWDCAVMCSLQKVNPLTGEKIDIENGLSKDPKQNYLRLPEQKWLDGYSNEGKVYQFVITKSGINLAVNEYILPESEQDSYALAFAFFDAKKPKEKIKYSSCIPGYYSGGYYPLQYDNSYYFDNSYQTFSKGSVLRGEVKCSSMNYSTLPRMSLEQEMSNEPIEETLIDQYKEYEKASMGAGGRIFQEIIADVNSTDYYEEKPSATLIVYLVFQEQFDDIMKKGKRQDGNKKDRFVNSGKIGGISIPLVGKND